MGDPPVFFQSIAVPPPLQEPGERIDKFIARFEIQANAFYWDDARKAKMFPAFVRDVNVVAKIVNMPEEARQSFAKMKLKLVDFHRAEVLKWIRDFEFEPEDIDQAIAEMSRLVDLAFSESSAEELKELMVRDLLEDKLPAEVRHAVIDTHNVPELVTTVKLKALEQAEVAELPSPSLWSSTPNAWVETEPGLGAGTCFTGGDADFLAQDCGLRKVNAVSLPIVEEDCPTRAELVFQGVDSEPVIDAEVMQTICVPKPVDDVPASEIVCGLPLGGSLLVMEPVKASFEFEDRRPEESVNMPETGEVFIGADFLHKDGAVLAMDDKSLSSGTEPNLAVGNIGDISTFADTFPVEWQIWPENCADPFDPGGWNEFNALGLFDPG